MSTKWFVQINDRVDGPLTTDDVQARMESGIIDNSHLIWGAGMDQWRRVDWWSSELPNMNTQTHVNISPEAWHYAFRGQSNGPFRREKLLDELKLIDALGEVLLWTKGMKEWAPLFEFHDILSALGVNKRQFPRAEIKGQAIIKLGNTTVTAPTVTISEGGLGLQHEGTLVPGQEISVDIQSPSFRQVLRAKAQVRYVSNGITGLRFSHVSVETKGAIIQFVRQSQTRFVLKAA